MLRQSPLLILKRVNGNGSAVWKRAVITTLLTAGTPLEPYRHSIAMKDAQVRWFEKDMDWAISSQSPNRGGFNDYPESGSRGKRSEMERPKPFLCGMDKI